MSSYSYQSFGRTSAFVMAHRAEISQSDQVVGGGEGEEPGDFPRTHTGDLAEGADDIDPSESFLNPFPGSLADLMPLVARGLSIKSRPFPRFILCRMKSDIIQACSCHKLQGIVVFVSAEGDGGDFLEYAPACQWLSI